MFRLLAPAALVIALTACATDPSDSAPAALAPPEMREARVMTQTDAQNGVFVVSLSNPTDRAVCLDDGDWPSGDYLGKEANPSGSLHNASDRVFATVGTERFPIEHEDMGYCDPSVTDLQDGNACRTVFPAESQTTAVIPFARFPGLVQASAAGNPVLTYEPTLSACGS